MAVAVRGGGRVIWRDRIEDRVVFHTDRGWTYTATAFTSCAPTSASGSPVSRVGSCFDNAAAGAFFSSLEWEVLSRNDFDTTRQAQAVVIDWAYGFYNHQRRHSAIGLIPPVQYEQETAQRNRAAA